MGDRAGRQDERVAWSTSEPVPAPLAPETAASVDPLEQRLVTGLAKIGLATRHRARAEAEGRGLTPTQGQITALLRARGETGMRLSELADAWRCAHRPPRWRRRRGSVRGWCAKRVVRETAASAPSR